MTSIDYEAEDHNISINHFNSFKLCHVFYDVKYVFSKKYLLGVFYDDNKGQIHKMDIYKKRFKKLVEI